MRVFIAGECYGVVRDAFLRLGHDAWSCDLKDSRVPGPHLRGDIRDHIHKRWDLMIAHPDCTRMANCGVQYLEGNPERQAGLLEDVEFFKFLWNYKDIPLRCIENPIPHKYGIGKTYTQIIHPWQFGHPEQKPTCLWLTGLPELIPTNILPPPYEQRIWKMSPGPMRKEWRAVYYPGFAWAKADQWGGLCI